MATYTEMVDKVLSWSNRDTDVLSYTDIKDFINYGVDNAYRTLRVAPLEATLEYAAITEAQAEANSYKLAIPTDLIDIIQVRRKKNEGNTDSNYEFDLYNPKADIQSFYDIYLTKYAERYFARERGSLLLSPSFEEGEVYQLYYYRRLPEMDARFSVNTDSEETNSKQYYATSKDTLISNVETAEGSDVFTKDPDLEDSIASSSDSDMFWLGKLTSNWLRDQNEKVVLYGALMQAGVFLQDTALEQTYTQRFLTEIETLNKEDKMRRFSGGNIQVHFSGHGLI